MDDHYQFLDSGNLQRLERFGKHLLIRPCAQALWKPNLSLEKWRQADAVFSREEAEKWSRHKALPAEWRVQFSGLQFKIAPTDFGHVGLFPEHSLVWEAMRANIRAHKRRLSILNLFAYSGGASLAAAQAGAQVCHLDASKGMVSWARENAALNNLEGSIRWIVDDVMKFLKREIKRGVFYDGIILDPPTFGRGSQGEIFKIEREIGSLLELSRAVLCDRPAFVFFTSHTPGMTPKVLHHLLSQMMHGKQGKIEERELLLGEQHPLPSGSMAHWMAL
jgi:23S rRNA (cytosine1962-C5)-methyltransferase